MPTVEPKGAKEKELRTTKLLKKESVVPRTDFTDFFLNKKFADVTIVTSDGKELPAHRVILANESPVFLHKFEHSLQADNRLELKSFDSQTVTDILR